MRQHFCNSTACAEMQQHMQLPLDANDEDVPVCCCDSPCTNHAAKHWFCPPCLSIARKCWATGKSFEYPKGRTVPLEWFAYKKNFEYLYCGANGRAFVIKRAVPATPFPSVTRLPCWQIVNVTEMWSINKSPRNIFASCGGQLDCASFAG